ncbi:MAG: glycosyltransferase, partial [Actinobacteria bacterium]|nr:glycosyltransferase [Actinomycetota bacterium]
MRRRIAFISHESPLAALGGVDAGGQVVYVGQLAKKLVSLGYEVDVFTRSDDARLPQVVEWDNGVRVIHIKAGPVTFIKKEQLFPYMDEFASNMVKFTGNEKDSYGLIHANFWLAGLVALKIKKQLGIPFVTTFHALGHVRRVFQGSKDKFPDERFAIEADIIGETARVIAECPQDKDDLTHYYNADSSKITIIPAGFDPMEFYSIDKLLSRMILNLDDNKPII